MTTSTLQERITTISRYFSREKWKNESGIFQYPRGKKRTDAVAEALEIAFESSEFKLKKELNLRGDDVIGTVFLIAVNIEDMFGGYTYLSLTITDHMFVVTQLPEKSVEALTLLEVDTSEKTSEVNTEKTCINEEEKSSNENETTIPEDKVLSSESMKESSEQIETEEVEKEKTSDSDKIESKAEDPFDNINDELDELLENDLPVL